MDGQEIIWRHDNSRCVRCNAIIMQLDLFPDLDRVSPPDTPFVAELHRRSGNYLKLLTRLQEGPATNRELAAIAGHRFGGRLLEARQSGAVIETKSLGGGLFEYRLVTMPKVK